MKPQEVITLMIDLQEGHSQEKSNLVNTHPELDQFFNKGMYIESAYQNCLDNGKCIITFIFRYYNTSQSKIS